MLKGTSLTCIYFLVPTLVSYSSMLHQVKNKAEVFIVIVIPRNKIQNTTSTSIKDGGSLVTFKVSGHKRLITVSKQCLISPSDLILTMAQISDQV
jgi:hypothetical protein